MANSIRDIAGTLPGSQVEPSTRTGGASVSNYAAESSANDVQPASDHTALSGLADAVRAAISQASALSSFRPELVAQLKSAIASQSYTPEPDQVAARIAAAVGKH
jgi:anti-sigma28 factor (negative regulator of flagellin synthesis)